MLTAILTALLTAPTAQNALIVERAHAGRVAIGAIAQDVYQQFGAHLIDLKLEGFLTPALEITLSGSDAPSMIAEIWPSGDKLVITRIRVLDPRGCPSYVVSESSGFSMYGKRPSRGIAGFFVKCVASSRNRAVASVLSTTKICSRPGNVFMCS
jgi:hypothetical protein